MRQGDSNPSKKSLLLRRAGGRLPVLTGVLALLFLVLAARLVQLGLAQEEERRVQASARTEQARWRPELVDRNGSILAIDVPTSSLYADPEQLIGVDETAEKLAAVLPGTDAEELRTNLSAKKRFQWVKRYLAPDERSAVFDLGLPGLDFLEEPKRFYPLGPLTAHVTGYVDVDNKGLAGMEHALDVTAQKKNEVAIALDAAGGAVALSIDVRVQHAVDIELREAMQRYEAKAAVGIVLDIDTGEILALASLPSFDPLNRAEALQPEHLDRARRGVYELGSVLKCFTVAMGIDENAVSPVERIDVATPLKLGPFAIKDEHATGNGTMSIEEVFIHSSNVGAARIARKVGVDRHRAFLSRLGLLERMQTEAGAAGLPLQPATWKLADSLSIAFGYRLSASPLQFAAASMALFNGGVYRPVTFLRRPADLPLSPGLPVLKSDTSQMMRRFMRANVERGTGRLADVPAYRVGGKTGTARKVKSGAYSSELVTSFLAIFPAESPRYLTYVVLDEPQKTAAARRQNTASVNAAPLTARLIERIAPFLGVKPEMRADN